MQREVEVDETGTFITSTVFDSSSEFDILFKLHTFEFANRIDGKNQMKPTQAKSFGTSNAIFYNRKVGQREQQQR